MASLTLDRVTKQFSSNVNSVRAVDNANLTVADGEFIALLGPSGCGKTTTLRMVAGLEIPNSGKIYIGDREVTDLAARERDIAMVFQDYALYPHMTVLENVGYPLKVRGVNSQELGERVRQVARQLQIDHLLERRPGQLSGGQQQRVALARAVVHKAQVTLFDEPLSNLDTKLRVEARAFLKRLQREAGITSLYVTHDQGEAMAMADHIVVMNGGKIMQVGTPMDVYRRPANTFVASFIGSPPMNLLPCTIDPENRVAVFANNATLPFSALGESAALLISGNVTLGIRPEHITLHTEAPEGVAALPAEHYVTQQLGSETVVLVRIGEELIAVRITEDEIPPLPDQVFLSFKSETIFFYDVEGVLIA